MVFKFNAAKAVSYAMRFSNRPNPYFVIFDDGKENVSFVSQCLLAGCEGVNSQCCPQWHYINENKYTESWVDFDKLKSFLLSKSSCGPVARMVPQALVGVGDVIFCEGKNEGRVVGFVTKVGEGKIFFVSKKKVVEEKSLEDCCFEKVDFLQILAVKK